MHEHARDRSLELVDRLGEHEQERLLGAAEPDVEALGLEGVLHLVGDAVEVDREHVVEDVPAGRGDHAVNDQVALLALAGVEGHDLEPQLRLEPLPVGVAVEDLVEELDLLAERRDHADRHVRAFVNHPAQLLEDEFGLCPVDVLRRALRSRLEDFEAHDLGQGLAADLDGLQLAVVEVLRREADQLLVAAEMFAQHRLVVGDQVEEFEDGLLDVEVFQPLELCGGVGHVGPEVGLDVREVAGVDRVARLRGLHVRELLGVAEDHDLLRPQDGRQGLRDGNLAGLVDDDDVEEPLLEGDVFRILADAGDDDGKGVGEVVELVLRKLLLALDDAADLLDRRLLVVDEVEEAPVDLPGHARGVQLLEARLDPHVVGLRERLHASGHVAPEGGVAARLGDQAEQGVERLEAFRAEGRVGLRRPAGHGQREFRCQVRQAGDARLRGLPVPDEAVGEARQAFQTNGSHAFAQQPQGLGDQLEVGQALVQVDRIRAGQLGTEPEVQGLQFPAPEKPAEHGHAQPLVFPDEAQQDGMVVHLEDREQGQRRGGAEGSGQLAGAAPGREPRNDFLQGVASLLGGQTGEDAGRRQRVERGGEIRQPGDPIRGRGLLQARDETGTGGLQFRFQPVQFVEVVDADVGERADRRVDVGAQRGHRLVRLAREVGRMPGRGMVVRLDLLAGGGGDETVERVSGAAQPQDRIGEVVVAVAHLRERGLELVLHDVEGLGLVREDEHALPVEDALEGDGRDRVRLACAGRALHGDVVALWIPQGRKDLPLLLVDRDRGARHEAFGDRQRVPLGVHRGGHGNRVLEDEALDDVVEQAAGALLFLAERREQLLVVVDQRLVGLVEDGEVGRGREFEGRRGRLLQRPLAQVDFRGDFEGGDEPGEHGLHLVEEGGLSVEVKDPVGDGRNGQLGGLALPLLEDPVDGLLVDQQVRVEFEDERPVVLVVVQRRRNVEQRERVWAEPDVAQIQVERLVLRRTEGMQQVAQLLEGVGGGEVLEERLGPRPDVRGLAHLVEDRPHRSGVAGDDQGVHGRRQAFQRAGGQDVGEVGLHVVDRFDGRVGRLPERSVEQGEQRLDDPRPDLLHELRQDGIDELLRVVDRLAALGDGMLDGGLGHARDRRGVDGVDALADQVAQRRVDWCRELVRRDLEGQSALRRRAGELPDGLVERDVFAQRHARPEADVRFELDAPPRGLLFLEVRLQEGQEIAQHLLREALADARLLGFARHGAAVSPSPGLVVSTGVGPLDAICTFYGL